MPMPMTRATCRTMAWCRVSWPGDARGMDHVRFDPARIQPTRQPEAIAAGFEGQCNPRDLFTGPDRFIAPTMQQAKKPFRARFQLLLRLALNAGEHTGDQPARLAQLDDGNDCAILVQGDEGPAQVVQLGHKGTPSVSYLQRRWCHLLRRLPHTISPLEGDRFELVVPRCVVGGNSPMISAKSTASSGLSRATARGHRRDDKSKMPRNPRRASNLSRGRAHADRSAFPSRRIPLHQPPVPIFWRVAGEPGFRIASARASRDP